MHLAKGQNLLQELEQENKSGFQLGESNRSSDNEDRIQIKGNLDKKGGLAALGAGLNKQGSDDAIGDNYDDDFDDDIEEDLPADGRDDDDLQIEDEGIANRNQPGAASGSGQGITVS